MGGSRLSRPEPQELLKAREIGVGEGLIQDLRKNLGSEFAAFLHVHASCKLSPEASGFNDIPSEDADVTEFFTVISCLNSNCEQEKRSVSVSFITISGLP